MRWPKRNRSPRAGRAASTHQTNGDQGYNRHCRRWQARRLKLLRTYRDLPLDDQHMGQRFKVLSQLADLHAGARP